MSRFLFFLLTLSLFLSCKDKTQELAAVHPIDTVDWSSAQKFYQKNMTEAVELIDALSKMDAESQEAKETFIKLRVAFKKAEPYASYLNPEVGHRANGPALPVFAEDTERILNPIGLQKIEESIYEGGEVPAVFKRETNLTKG